MYVSPKRRKSGDGAFDPQILTKKLADLRKKVSADRYIVCYEENSRGNVIDDDRLLQSSESFSQGVRSEWSLTEDIVNEKKNPLLHQPENKALAEGRWLTKSLLLVRVHPDARIMCIRR